MERKRLGDNSEAMNEVMGINSFSPISPKQFRAIHEVLKRRFTRKFSETKTGIGQSKRK